MQKLNCQEALWILKRSVFALEGDLAIAEKAGDRAGDWYGLVLGDLAQIVEASAQMRLALGGNDGR